MLPSFGSLLALPRTNRFAVLLSSFVVALALLSAAVHGIAQSALHAGLRGAPVRLDALGNADEARIDALESALREQPFVASVTRVRPAEALAKAGDGSADIARLVAAYPVANPFPEGFSVTLRDGAAYQSLLEFVTSGAFDDVLGSSLQVVRAQTHNAALIIGALRTAARISAVLALLAIVLAAMTLASQLSAATDTASAMRVLVLSVGIGCGMFVVLFLAVLFSARGIPAFHEAIPGMLWRAVIALVLVTAWPTVALWRLRMPAAA